MGILDEAIREHLELKRQHGAGDSELQQIEDEAFGPPARPDELATQPAVPDVEAEAPTTHMPAPEAEAAPVAPEAAPVAPEEAAEPAPVEPEPVPEEEHPAV